MSNDARENVFPEVTTCGDEIAPTARSLELATSTAAQLLAVPFDDTAPSVMAVEDTFLPFGVPAAGAPKAPPVAKVLLPRSYVLVASVKFAASCDVMKIASASVSRTLRPLSSTRSDTFGMVLLLPLG